MNQPIAQPMPPRRTKPRSIVYNVGGKPDRIVLADINRMIRDEDPDVIGFNEVHDRLDVLKTVGRLRDYRLIFRDDVPGADHVAILVRKRFDVQVERVGLKELTPVTFVGFKTAGAKKDGKAGAKSILFIKVVIRGYRRKYGVVHLVPSAARKGNWRTKLLHGRQVAGCAAWLRNSENWQAILMGDLNALPSSPLLRLLRVVAKLYSPGGKYMNRIIMFAVARHFRGWKRLAARARSLRSYSSDHAPVILEEKS